MTPLRSLALALDRRMPFDLRALKWRLAEGAKGTLGVAARYGGLWFLARRTYLRGKVGILVYHDPTPETLDRHLAFLARRYRFVSLDALVEALRSGEWSSLPPNSLVVTIDDGWRRNRDLLGVFARYGVTPTIFLCTGIVGTSRGFWWRRLDAPTRHRLYRVANRERLEILRREFGFEQTAEDGEAEALSREDVEAMRPAVDFQPHTRFHPRLTTCDDAEAEAEIAGSRADFPALTGGEGRHFSYPFGVYGEREIALVRTAGYESARAFGGGFTDARTDPYELRAVGVRDTSSLTLLAATLTFPRLAPL